MHHYCASKLNLVLFTLDVPRLLHDAPSFLLGRDDLPVLVQVEHLNLLLVPFPSNHASVHFAEHLANIPSLLWHRVKVRYLLHSNLCHFRGVDLLEELRPPITSMLCTVTNLQIWAQNRVFSMTLLSYCHLDSSLSK